MPKRNQNGLAIRTFRAIRQVSRDDLAKDLGISYPYLTNIELEYKNCPEHLLAGISYLLDVDADALRRYRPTAPDEEQPRQKKRVA